MMLYFKPEFSRQSGERWSGYDVVDIKQANGINRDWMGCQLKTYDDLAL